MQNTGSAAFPVYTPGERRADAAVHALGLFAGLGGGVWLLSSRAGLPAAEWLALGAYLGGLGGMLLASAAYNTARDGRLKEILRRLDHAMIYAMIAGSYTPFAVRHMQRGGGDGTALGAAWSIALLGIVLKLCFPRRFERAGTALYLGLGWGVLFLEPGLWPTIPTASLVLLVAGGLLYTAGTAVHLMDRVRYHNAVWHGFVLAAAGCHFAAIALDSVP
ncbi:hemolysin III family protein [Azospirillum sp. SYSU D00513]|uniref:PAQR family membrane homeostasis protein TrhA n=1 Tax=Azospirillum sp. SYSU D00513 TaxID=2812561 RepID=UPI001A959CE3|nr:hemolysin III family protein [Azospirillum sp. SYSU D00513]